MTDLLGIGIGTETKRKSTTKSVDTGIAVTDMDLMTMMSVGRGRDDITMTTKQTKRRRLDGREGRSVRQERRNSKMIRTEVPSKPIVMSFVAENIGTRSIESVRGTDLVNHIDHIARTGLETHHLWPSER